MVIPCFFWTLKIKKQNRGITTWNSWYYHGNTVCFYHGNNYYRGGITRATWFFSQIFIWFYHGNTMSYHGNIISKFMVLPWCFHQDELGITVVKPRWYYQVNTFVFFFFIFSSAYANIKSFHIFSIFILLTTHMVLPWYHHGITMVLPWYYHDITMSLLCKNLVL